MKHIGERFRIDWVALVNMDDSGALRIAEEEMLTRFGGDDDDYVVIAFREASWEIVMFEWSLGTVITCKERKEKRKMIYLVQTVKVLKFIANYMD